MDSCMEDYVELYAEVKVETRMAILCDFGDKEVWIPKSQIHDNSEVWKKGQKGEVMVAIWLAEELGLI